MSKKVNNPSPRHGVLLLALLVIVLVVGGGVFILHRNASSKTIPPTGSTIPSTKPSNKTTTPSTGKQTPALNNPVNPPSYKSSNIDSSGSGLATPSDNDLVSNHSPSISAPPPDNQEQSICTTTPGASCYIAFTKGGVTKQLQAQTTDSNGSAYWTWSIGQAGLTQGSWQVTAVASLNGQTATALDSIPLEVQQ